MRRSSTVISTVLEPPARIRAPARPAKPAPTITTRVLTGCVRGGATLATVSGDARSGSSGDDLGLHVDMPDDVAVPFGNKDVSLAVKPNFVWRAQQRRLRRSAIPRVAFRSRARNDINALRRQIQA